MLDKILNSLGADPLLDEKVNVARMVGGYIKKYPNGAGVNLTPEYIKELAFPDRRKIQQAKDREFANKFIKYVESEIEKERVEQIRKSHTDSLSTIYDKTRELRGETDKISLKSDEIEQKLSARQEELRKKLENIQEENKSLLEKQLGRIEMGEKEIAGKFNNAFQSFEDKMPTFVDHLKNEVSDFEKRLIATKMAEKQAEENRPKPVYEQVLIEETGQIITLEK